MKTLAVICFFGLTATLFVGCADSTTSTVDASEVINTHCPVMGGKVNPESTVDWNGKKVGFCCPPCLDEWAAMSDEERQAALTKAEAGEGGEHDHGEESHKEHGEHAEHGDGAGDGNHSEHKDHAEGSDTDTAADTETAAGTETEGTADKN